MTYNYNDTQFLDLVSEIQTTQEAAGIAVAAVNAFGEILYQNFFGYRDAEKKLPMNEDGAKERSSGALCHGRYNVFHASLIIRHSEDGKNYLYDVIDIKKETSNPLES